MIAPIKFDILGGVVMRERVKINKKLMAGIVCSVMLFAAISVFAESNPLDPNSVTALSDITKWIANIFKAIGGIVFLFGGVQTFMGFKNEDPDQKYRGLRTLAAGLGVVAIATGYTYFVK